MHYNYLLQVSPNSTEDTIVCECSHMSAFSGSFFVKPNSLELFKMELFLKVFKNSIVVVTVCVAWFIYIVLLVWARRRDQHDTQLVRKHRKTIKHVQQH